MKTMRDSFEKVKDFYEVKNQSQYLMKIIWGKMLKKMMKRN